MSKREIGVIVFGIVLIISGILTTFLEPEWIVSVSGTMGGLIGAGTAALLIGVWNLKKEKAREVTSDERDYKIAEKATFKVFQVMFPVTGFSFAILSFVKNDLGARPVLGILFGFMGILYTIFYYHYRRKM